MLRRARSDARLLTGAAVAIVVALVVVAAAPVYLRSLEKAGVKHRLNVLTPSRTAFHINTSWIPLERPEYLESDAMVDAARDKHVADVVTGKFDIIALIEATDMSAMADLVTGQVQGIRGVLRTITCVAAG